MSSSRDFAQSTGDAHVSCSVRHAADFHAWIGNRLVRTFNSADLAQAYRKKMRKFGADVTIREALIVRRAA
jgi:hypothetical protein